jgi:formiminotetrahydrofolate cyclodeaminase
MDRLDTMTLARFLDAVAAKSPTPGGGAVAASTGAVAAALGSMVVAYSLGKKNLAEHQATLECASSSLRRARDIFLELAEEDAAGYAVLNELLKLPPEDPRRDREMPGAVEASMAPPRATVAAAADLMRLLESLAPITNRHLRSDLAVAAGLAEATARAGWWNIAANISMVTDTASRESMAREASGLLRDASARRAVIERACAFEGMSGN